jgi:hypothetical protein
MSALSTTPNPSLVAHVRRLSAAGPILYIRIDNRDVSRLGLSHGQTIEIDLGRTRVAGIVKTSGGSPWLAPSPGSSNATITATLRGAHLEHGMDVSATVRPLSGTVGLSTAPNAAPNRAFPRTSVSLPGYSGLRIDPNDAARDVRDYNRGFYRGCRNVDLDREAYRRFESGLSSSLAQLIDQIAFVGEQYGGAQARFLPHSIRMEAALIVPNLQSVVGQWVKAVTDAKPLIDETPSEGMLAFLSAPFAATKQWPVWASKTLHFLRPDCFPILDSNAKKALGLRNLGSSSRDYYRFSSCFRDALSTNSEALTAARIADNRESPTDLKLLDKILFQIGSRMK